MEYMTLEERKAYKWAIEQPHTSVAATHARTLANYLKRARMAPIPPERVVKYRLWADYGAGHQSHMEEIMEADGRWSEEEQQSVVEDWGSSIHSYTVTAKIEEIVTVGRRYIFKTSDERDSHDGQEVEVITAFLEPDDQHDEEVLPMYGIRFDDGREHEAFPDELTGFLKKGDTT